ncbi:MAG: hypothetical protein ACI9MC_001598, partial [Kiritimatiellia bacterium]
GGISAEGQVGDVKIYNDRVQFIVQGVRDGSYYERSGGHVIDVDVVRPIGQPGRDVVDEWLAMYGLGRLVNATSIEVISDGSEGEARVRVIGTERALDLFVGVTENPNIVPRLGLTFQVDYVLAPDSNLLQVHTTVTAGSLEARFNAGDAIFGAMEAVQPWDPAQGLDVPADDDRRFTGYIGNNNEVAVALVPPTGKTASIAGTAILLELADLVVSFEPVISLQPGETMQHVRYYGVGDNMAQITDAIAQLDEVATQTISDVVQSDEGPVPGARVHVYVDDVLYTVAVTDAEGRYQANVPVDADVRVLATGRLQGVQVDLPDGWAPGSLYSAPSVRDRQIASLTGDAPRIFAADGYGVANPQDPLKLLSPGTVSVRAADDGPFEVRFVPTKQPEHDRRLVSGLMSGAMALGWGIDGSLDMKLPPGTYDVWVHRGLRFERHHELLTVATGETSTVVAPLDAAYAHPGFLLGDPHMHAAPSPDGLVSMEERLAVAAGVGIQLHFGTDHDHVANYRHLLEPMGLAGVLATVVACEVSPVTRGHSNAYPLKERDLPNHGAVSWWSDLPETTEILFDRILAMGDDVVVQMNHPTDQGVAVVARWRQGEIGLGDRWSSRYEAFEVLNGGGGIDEFLPVYFDLLNRGMVMTPVGVSDSHSHTGGAVGASATFLGMGTDDPTEYSDAKLVEAMRSRRTIATRGPFLQMSIDPGSVIEGGDDLTVQALSPSWIVVDRLILFRDGAPVQTVLGTSATFELRPDDDASYVVIAEGDQPMGGTYGGTKPWAMSSPIRVDVAGDGWTPPLEPLQIR